MAADYGREEGWYAIWRGQAVAELTDPRWSEMFWTSWKLEMLTSDPETIRALERDETWWKGEIDLRTRVTDQHAPHAFASRAPVAGRVSMRGLYLLDDLTLVQRTYYLLLLVGVFQTSSVNRLPPAPRESSRR
jgi:hypothetical protein